MADGYRSEERKVGVQCVLCKWKHVVCVADVSAAARLMLLGSSRRFQGNCTDLLQQFGTRL